MDKSSQDKKSFKDNVVEDIHQTVRAHMKQTKEKLQVVRESLLNEEIDLTRLEIEE